MSEYWFCTKHHTVETGDDICPAIDRLGPYGSADEASHALEKAQERNEDWDRQDAEWNGE